MSIGMAVMVLALSGAGILQVWLQRMPTTGAMPSWPRKTSWCSSTGCVWQVA
jgi:nitric oxide reductase large subunit